MYLKNFKLQSFSLQSKTTQETRSYMTVCNYKNREYSSSVLLVDIDCKLNFKSQITTIVLGSESLQSLTASSSLIVPVLTVRFQKLNSPTLSVPRNMSSPPTNKNTSCSTTQSILAAPLFSWYPMATMHEKQGQNRSVSNQMSLSGSAMAAHFT